MQTWVDDVRVEPRGGSTRGHESSSGHAVECINPGIPAHGRQLLAVELLDFIRRMNGDFARALLKGV